MLDICHVIFISKLVKSVGQFSVRPSLVMTSSDVRLITAPIVRSLLLSIKLDIF